MIFRRKKLNCRVVEYKPVRHKLRFLLTMVLAVTMAADRLVRQIDIAFTKIEIGGVFNRVGAEQVRGIVSTYTSARFFEINVTDVQNALERLPWVQQAEVARVWPAKMRVTIFEKTPLAAWGQTGRLISSAGQVFQPPLNTVPDDLPVLAGPIRTEAIVLGRYRHFQRILSRIGRKIRRLELDQRRSWNMKLDNGIQLMLGHIYVDQRLQRFVSLYKELFDARTQHAVSTVVDLRYGNGFAIRADRRLHRGSIHSRLGLEEPEAYV